MPTQNIKKFDDEILDVKKQSLYARLKRLFSTDVIVRNVGGKQLKIKDTDNVMHATDRNSLRDRFNRIRSTAYNAYTRDFALSYQAARMDLFRDYDTQDMDPIISCLAPTTYVSTLDGFVTIKELSEKYPNGEYFKVWSWDKDGHKLTLGNAHHPRKTGTKNVIELHLDNGEIVKCTPDHRMMLVNGTYKEAGKLLPGESLMPFYHRINNRGYREIKSLGKRFKLSHRYIFEDVLNDAELDGYNIHHKNHNKLDNKLENLEKLTAIDHCRLHGISPTTNGKRSEKCKELWTNLEYRKKCSSALEQWRNSEEGKKMMSEHSSIINKNRWKNDTEYVLKMAQIFSDHAKSLWNDPTWKEWKRKKHSETMKLKYANDPTYAEKTKHIGNDNGRYKDCITTEAILVEGMKFNSLIELAKAFDFRGLTFKNNQYRCQFLSRRIKEAGYNGWIDYKNKFSYSNHKVTKIVDNNEIMDVYDLTVDFYENFALKQGIICSNSALDIYADECIHGDTIIPLVTGEKIRIEDLYKEQRTNFVVYSLDNDGKQISAICNRVALNGKKSMLKLVLNDNTEIKCTSEHQWLDQHGKIVTTQELSIGHVLSNNHKVVSIQEDGEYDAYDLVNVGNTTHLYAVETKDGSKLFTHNCLTYNEMGKMLTVHSNNNNVKQILENLFNDILNIQFNLWSWTRNMCKYGDFYLKLYITPEYGVYMVEPISAYNVERIENADPYNKRYVKFQLRPTDTSQSEVLENYEMAHFRLMSDSNFLPYGKCLTANSYVKTEFGSKRIDEVKVGDKVWSFDKELNEFSLTSVLNKCSSGVKETLRISSQHNEIECSPDHPILIYSNNIMEYKLAKNISIGDLFVLTSNTIEKSRLLCLNKTLLTEGNCNGWRNNLETLPSYPDGKFARFFGFMLGDGWINKGLNRVSFAAGIDETLNERYANLLGEYSRKDPIILPPKENSGGQRYVDSKLLAEFLHINGFVGDATTKRIPQWVYELDEWSKLEFIRGLVDADGSVFTDKWNVNRYAIELANKPLVEDIKELLRGMNIKCSNVKSRRIEGETEICGVKCHRNTAHYIYFYLDGNRKSQLQKYDFVKNKNIILDPIISITENGLHETYDIQIESSNSNFIANGIVVHNSMIEGARRVWKQLSLMEDAMLIHRIMRAPEKRIFYTDIGNIPPTEVDAYMQKMMDKMKKVPYMDEQSGEYNLRFNLQNMVEDYYIPVRGGDSGTKIDTLGGMEWTGTEDIEYLRNKLMAALKIPKAFLGYEEGISGKATLACIVPETKIPLLDGKTKTVLELIDDYNNGVRNYVYSIDETTKDIVSGEIKWAGFTRMNVDVIRVHLDNGKYIDCTPDHKFMTREGEWVESKDLMENQSLMPLYRRKTKIGKINDYDQIYNPSDNKWKYTHKIVDNYINGTLIQKEKFSNENYICVHHKDYNRFNNNPDNLVRMTWKEHGKLHEKNYFYLKEWIEKNGHYSRTDAGRDFISQRNRDEESYKNLRIGYNIKYKNGKYDTSGKLNGKWRERPAFTDIIENINTYSGKKEDLNTIVSLSKYMKYHVSIIREVIEENEYSVTEFLNQYIGFRRGRANDIKKLFFTEEIMKYKNPYHYIKSNGISYNGYHSILKYIDKENVKLNHKVVKVEVLSGKRDTCDITVEKYHNFATEAGVIIHNSEDVRFARTIQRIQKIICSELTKIAIVHLYSQGYRDESLVDFELELTNPSTIFEKEKLEIFSDKISVATDMVDNKFFSHNWIYKNIFHMSDDDIKEVKDEVVEDAKQRYRFTSIEEDGDDPAKPFKKIGGKGGKDSEDGGGGGGGGGLGDLGDIGDMGGDEGGPDLGGDKGPGGGPDLGGGGPEGLKEIKIKPKHERRDQSGKHKASDHPFGEDVLGADAMDPDEKMNSENRKKSGFDPGNLEGSSPFQLREQGHKQLAGFLKTPKRMDSDLISSLSEFLKRTPTDTKKELIKENISTNSRSLMDEKNIIPNL